MNRQVKHDILRLFALTVALLLMVVILSGCRPTQILNENNSETHDTIVQIHHTRDSIYIRDSVFVKTANDTVYIDRWRERCRYLIERDTIYQTRDSVQVRVVTQKEVVEVVPWYCKTSILLLLLAVVLFLILFLFKR